MPDTPSSIDALTTDLGMYIEEDVLSKERESIQLWVRRYLQKIIKCAWACRDAKTEAEFAARIMRCYRGH